MQIYVWTVALVFLQLHIHLAIIKWVCHTIDANEKKNLHY